MASVGHLVAGAVAARWHDGRLGWRSVVAFSTFSLAPDLDVLAFRFGVPYAAPFGHRGATHSLAFACVAGLLAWVLTRRVRSAVALGAVVLSHPLLDMLTDGGLGVALFWPLSDARLFFPWTPLPVSPLGSRLLSARGAYVLAVESALFAPALLALALRRPATETPRCAASLDRQAP